MNQFRDLVRRKPRTTILAATLAVALGGAFYVFAESMEVLWTLLPLLLCLGMHGLMHGSHGKGHHDPTDKDQPGPQAIPVRARREEK